MRENVRRLLKQQAFEVLHEERRSSFVTRKGGVTYRIWPHMSWTMNMEQWRAQARDKTYPTETWILLCWIPGTKYWFAVYQDKRPVELWHDLETTNNKGE